MSYHEVTGFREENRDIEKLAMLRKDSSARDSALPYFRFAYNTTRQEVTGRSPFFLIYVRHPMLPVDAICVVDPDPSQIVSVESGGPRNYEEWMLGNLQKALAEVDGKSQATQERGEGVGGGGSMKGSRRYYCTNRRGKRAGLRSCCTVA